MRKLISVLLILALTLSLFAGCGGKDDAKKDPMDTPMADARVRQALSYAVDKDAIVEGIYANTVLKADALTVPGPLQAEGLEAYDYNPEKAKELLKEANWDENYVIDFATYYDNQEAADIMVAVQSMWAAIGVKSQIRVITGDLTTQLWVAPEDMEKGPSAVTWDVLYAGISAPNEAEFYARFGSSAPNNSHTPKNAKIDAALAKTQTIDAAAQTAAYQEVQLELNKNANYVPLIHVSSFIFTSDRLDRQGGKMGNDQWAYDDNIINWTTTNSNGRIYTNGGPMEFYHNPFINPSLYPYQDYVFDRLIAADEFLAPKSGLLAESYKMSDDGMEIVFELREGVKWHDGEEFNAEDVKFTIEYSLKVSGGSVLMTNVFGAIDGAQDFVNGKADSIKGIVIDGNKVTLKFEKVAPDAMMVFSQWPILPEHLLKDTNPATPQQGKFWQSPIGTGPFKVKETVISNYAILERNEDYFLNGTGNVKEIYMSASADSDPNIVKNAEAGRIDFAWSKQTTDAQAVGKIKGMEVTTVSVPFTRLFYFNQFPHKANVK